MFIAKAMTDTEAKQDLVKRFGTYDDYRKAALNYDEPVEKSAPVVKTDQQRFLDTCEYVAKGRGQSLEQYFRDNPSKYAELRKLSYSRED